MQAMKARGKSKMADCATKNDSLVQMKAMKKNALPLNKEVIWHFENLIKKTIESNSEFEKKKTV